MTVGVSSLGNIVSAAPLAWLIEAFGWRATVGSFAVLTALIAVAIAVAGARPPRETGGRGEGTPDRPAEDAGPVADPGDDVRVLRGPPRGCAGSGSAPTSATGFGADLGQIGTATLVMGLAMVAGNFL